MFDEDDGIDDYMPLMPEHFVAELGPRGNEAKLGLDAKIREWRVALKNGIEAGALPTY